MVEKGEPAPAFTVPMATGGAYNAVETFALEDALGDGPIVLAFYPAAFTSGCTTEMCTFRDSMGRFDDLDARVYGVSVDLPFAQNIFIEEHGLGFPMLSDSHREVIRAYGVVVDEMGDYGVREVAERSIFVIDGDGTVAYTWIREGDNPDFGWLVDEVAAAVEAVA